MEAPRSTWTARGRDVVFATAIALDGAAPAVSVTHSGAEPVVEVDGEVV